jgi:hypothetical protein
MAHAEWTMCVHASLDLKCTQTVPVALAQLDLHGMESQPVQAQHTAPRNAQTAESVTGKQANAVASAASLAMHVNARAAKPAVTVKVYV